MSSSCYSGVLKNRCRTWVLMNTFRGVAGVSAVTRGFRQREHVSDSARLRAAQAQRQLSGLYSFILNDGINTGVGWFMLLLIVNWLIGHFAMQDNSMSPRLQVLFSQVHEQ